MAATSEQLAELRATNARINAIPYNTIPSIGEGADVWKDTPDSGDWFCRDYVLAKADQLKTLGWAPTDLTVVLCWTEPVKAPPDPPTGQPSDTREYHAVLACDAGGNTWVLDSRFDDIYLWTQPPADYLWDRQQIAGTTDFRDVSVTGLT